MRYLTRAVKYFFYFLIVLVIIMTIMVALGFVEADINTMFRNGTDSLWQIAAMLVVFGAAYPYFGFMKRETRVKGEYSEIREGVLMYMESRAYILETEEGENMTFRAAGPLNRTFRMFEDRITLTRCLGGFVMEGLRKDVVRLSMGLEHKFRYDEQS